jgi:hypothetical protein
MGAVFTKISAYGAGFQARGKAVSAKAKEICLMREQLIARLKSADPTSDIPPVVSTLGISALEEDVPGVAFGHFVIASAIHDWSQARADVLGHVSGDACT